MGPLGEGPVAGSVDGELPAIANDPQPTATAAATLFKRIIFKSPSGSNAKH
jgi:hypothetical protein